MSDTDYKRVAIFVQGIIEKDEVATSADVKALTEKFNQKYGQAFRALAQ